MEDYRIVCLKPINGSVSGKEPSMGGKVNSEWQHN